MNNTAVTQGDTPAVEAAAVAPTADRQPPELPERKADFAKRMEAEGTAKEAEEFRHAEREQNKKRGEPTQLARDLAWASAMKKFPLADDATNVGEDEPMPEEEDELETPAGESMHVGGPIREELAALDKRCENQPVDLSRDIEWAYKMMNRQPGSVRPKDAPSPGSWNQLQAALSMGPVKYTCDVVNRVLVASEKKKNKASRDDDSETQFERLRKLREGLGVPPGPLPDFVIGDYPNKEV